MSVSDISWIICKFAPRYRQMTMLAPHHALAVYAVVASVCLSVCLFVTLRYCITSISANADGPRDAASRKKRLYCITTQYNYLQATSVGR